VKIFSRPTVSAKMVNNEGVIGFRVTVEIGNKQSSFFHEGNNQKDAIKAGKQKALQMKGAK